MREIPPPNPPPPLWVPDWELPPYRYVPGLNPHPFRHSGGHMYAGGSPPVELPWAADLPWEQDLRWLRGFDLFNHRYLWEAHEAFEALWHFAARDRPISDLLQGLVQAAAFALKRHMGTEPAAQLLLQATRARMLRLRADHGQVLRGVPLEELVRALEAHAGGGPWPLLPTPTTAQSPVA